ncbi:MAG: hypothetical protein ACJA0S_000784 [Rickettsiales bacterium]|jgi:hypothetical protein
MIEDILSQSLKFEGENESKKFTQQFKSLYGIAIFKDGLDLALTKARRGDLLFEVKIIKGWDTNDGCCISEETRIYNKILKAFTRSLNHKIIIRNFKTSVLAHEIGHAIAVSSDIALNDSFGKVIGFDIKNRQPESVVLASEIKRLMVNALKVYPPSQIISELFARYFELLSMSREVDVNGSFLADQINGFFINTSKWFDEIFNPKIKNQIDQDIANFTAKMINKGDFESQKKFADHEKSFYKKSDRSGNRSWSKNVNSNAGWKESWQKHQELEDKNNN